jgi:hypothetical protein
VGVDCGTLHLAKGEISVWDFAGQLEYTATHAFFLSIEVQKGEKRQKIEKKRIYRKGGRGGGGETKQDKT